MLRVGLDLRPLESGFKSHFGRGTGRYVAAVCEELLRLEDPDIQTVAIPGKQLMPSAFEQGLVKCLPFGRQTFETLFLLSRRLKRLPVDFLHVFFHADAAPFSRLPYSVTVADLIPLRFPKLYGSDQRGGRFRFARYLENSAIRNACGVIAVSEATKRDCIELLNVPAEKIAVAPHAVERKFFAPSIETKVLEYNRQQARVKLWLELPCHYLLYVGGIDPRKNVQFMLEMFAVAAREPNAPKMKLIMVGHYENDDQYPALLSKIRELGIEELVTLTGYVTDHDLLHYYEAADVFVFPSLYEGFGLPVLEAMAAGLPLLAPLNSSIPEVVGRTDILLPDNNLGAWVIALKQLLSQPQLRAELIADGYRRAQGFSWKRSAELTLDAFRQFAA